MVQGRRPTLGSAAGQGLTPKGRPQLTMGQLLQIQAYQEQWLRIAREQLAELKRRQSRGRLGRAR